MSKTLEGVVVSVVNNNLISVEITRKVQHPKYKKLMTRSKKFLVALNGEKVNVGDTVVIVETRPISKTVHFALNKAEKRKESK